MGEYKSKHTGLTVDNAVDKIPTTNPTADSVIVLNASGSPSYKALTDLGGGDVTAAGNNVFTGTNTFQYTHTEMSVPNPPIAYVKIIPKDGIIVDDSDYAVTNSSLSSDGLTVTQYGYTSSFKYGNVMLSAPDGAGNVSIRPESDGVKIITTRYDGKTGNVSIPYNASGTIAFAADVPNTSSFAKLNSVNTFTGQNLFSLGLDASSTIHASMGVRIGGDGIWFDDSSTGNISYTYPSGPGTTTTTNFKLPEKSAGNHTFAMTDDIKIKSATLSGTTLDITLG